LPRNWNIHILATDISRQPWTMRARVYDPRELETVTPRQREQYFSTARPLEHFCGQAAQYAIW